MSWLWFVNCQSEGLSNMITRRERRKRSFKRVGFLGFEAEALSVYPLNLVPYIKSMIRDRRNLLRDALRHNATAAQYKAAIIEDYHKDGFLKRNKVGKAVPDVWAMVRDYEDRYKAKYPAYESPGIKKRRIWVDFMAKVERTIAAQSQRKLRAGGLRLSA